MSNEKDLIHIFTVLECIEKIWIYPEKFTTAEELIWADKQMPLNAVVNLFIAIGEETKKVDSRLIESIESDVYFKGVTGIRDKLAHDYRGVDEKVLWNTIKNELPKLKESYIQMFKLVRPSVKLLNVFLDTPHYEEITYLKDV